jgi:hypothetical protein
MSKPWRIAARVSAWEESTGMRGGSMLVPNSES